jgi:O-antigen/teichoic acid export membrane protein
MVRTSSALAELKNLGRQSFHYMAGLIGNMGLGFISFPIFTRAFSVADYGLIDFTQKILLLPTAVSKMGMQNSALRFYNQGPESTPRSPAGYYSTMLLGVALAGIAITLLFLAGVKIAPGAMIDAPLARLLCFAGILILIRAVQSIEWAFLRVEERTKKFCFVGVAMKAATIAAICALLPWAGASAHTYFSGTIAAEIIFAAILLIPLLRKGLVRFREIDPGLLRAAVAFGLPMVVYELAGVALLYGDRGMVRHYLGEQALGYYTAAYGLSNYVNDFVTAPLGMAITPIYLRIWAKEGREQTSKFLSLSLGMFLMAAALVLAVTGLVCQDGLVLLASSKYAAAGPLIPVLVAAMLVHTTNQFLSAGLLIEKRTGIMALVFLGATMLNMGLNAVLLPRIGLSGAPISALVSRALGIGVLWRLSAPILPLSLRPVALLRYAAAGVTAWLVASQIQVHPILLNICLRGTIALVVYLGSLCLLDRRVRMLAAGMARGRMEFRAASAALLG